MPRMYVQKDKDHTGSVVGYEHLAISVVIAAVEDYRKAADKIRKNPKRGNTMYRKKMHELEDFFHSGWCDTLCQGLDTEELMERVIREGRQWCRNSSGMSAT